MLWLPQRGDAGFFEFKQDEQNEVVFIKLGGSLVTHREIPYTSRPEMIERLAQEIAQSIKAHPKVKFIIGHGSGSFGHRAAIEHHYHHEKGFSTPRDGASVAKSAHDLHAIVISALLKTGVPAFSIPPSATGRLARKTLRLVDMDIKQIQQVLDIGGVPIVYGDVIPFSDGKGTGIASTETVFSFLAHHFKPSKIILLGGTAGVYRSRSDIQHATGRHLSEVTPQTWLKIVSGVEGSSDYDVTGGMRQKVEWMIETVKKHPHTQVYIASGLHAGVLEQLLAPHPQRHIGTLIHAKRSY